jgi:uncharacterized lipoprotein YbaY
MSRHIRVSACTFSRVGLAEVFGMIANTASAQSIQGTATFRERMGLPPSAVFEATLEDVSRADAAAETIKRTRITSPGNPPIKFSIAYDPQRADLSAHLLQPLNDPRHRAHPRLRARSGSRSSSRVATETH